MMRIAMISAALLLPLQAQAQQSTSPLIEAGNALQAQLKTAAKDPPMLTNAGAPLVRTAFNADAIRTLPVSDVALVSNSCIAIGQTILAYVDFATRTSANAPDPNVASEAAMLRIQEEMTLGAIAANLCVKRGFQSVLPVVEGMDSTTRAGAATALGQMRAGTVQTIDGTLNTVVLAPTRPANRIRLLDSVLEGLPALAASFPSDERAKLRESVLKLAATAPQATKAKFSQIAAGLAATQCNTLCAVGEAD